jgi:hypothetical protein
LVILTISHTTALRRRKKKDSIIAIDFFQTTKRWRRAPILYKLCTYSICTYLILVCCIINELIYTLIRTKCPPTKTHQNCIEVFGVQSPDTECPKAFLVWRKRFIQRLSRGKWMSMHLEERQSHHRVVSFEALTKARRNEMDGPRRRRSWCLFNIAARSDARQMRHRTDGACTALRAPQSTCQYKPLSTVRY